MDAVERVAGAEAGASGSARRDRMLVSKPALACIGGENGGADNVVRIAIWVVQGAIGEDADAVKLSSHMVHPTVLHHWFLLLVIRELKTE